MPSDPNINKIFYNPSAFIIDPIYSAFVCCLFVSIPVEITVPPFYLQFLTKSVEFPTAWIFINSIAPEEVLLTVLLRGQ